jgi:hypothetical protein
MKIIMVLNTLIYHCHVVVSAKKVEIKPLQYKETAAPDFFQANSRKIIIKVLNN